MKMLDPMPTNCPACSGKYPVPLAALRSLDAGCPGCGASLAEPGRQLLESEARIGREIDLLIVELELEKRTGLALPDDTQEVAPSLSRLIQRVAAQLPPSPDREARAADLVASVAKEVVPSLLDDAEPTPVIP